MVMKVPPGFESKKENVDDECTVNSFTCSVLILSCFIYIMIDKDHVSILDSLGIQADAVLLFNLVHLHLHPEWSSQNYLWQCG